MPMPTDVPVIDLMLAVPNDDTSNFYDFIRPLLMDEQSRQMFKMPAQYMFKDLPKVGKRDDYIAYTLEKMDEFNIEKAMLGVDEGQYETQCEAVKKHPDRFFASYDCNPNNGMDEVRKIRRLKEQYDIKSVNAFPSGLCPQVSLSDKKWYPIFVTCIDLDIPLLLSRATLKRAGAKIDFDNDSIELLGINHTLTTTTTGHYCIKICRDPEIANSECQRVLFTSPIVENDSEQNRKMILKIHKQFANS